MIENPRSTPAKYHGELVLFDESLPKSEITFRGLCQLLIESFKEFHDLVREPLGLPLFREQLELILF